MSVPGNVINLYERAGIWILDGVFRGSLRGLPPGSGDFGPTEFGDPTPIAFMDYVVEESIQLVAAAMFAAAAVAGARYALDRRRSDVTVT
jgi:hypothetical protein